MKYNQQDDSQSQKKLSTPRDSRAVPQPSTNLALSCLASEFGWDLALSAQYGRQLIRLLGASHKGSRSSNFFVGTHILQARERPMCWCECVVWWTRRWSQRDVHNFWFMPTSTKFSQGKIEQDDSPVTFYILHHRGTSVDRKTKLTLILTVPGCVPIVCMGMYSSRRTLISANLWSVSQLNSIGWIFGEYQPRAKTSFFS